MQRGLAARLQKLEKANATGALSALSDAQLNRLIIKCLEGMKAEEPDAFAAEIARQAVAMRLPEALDVEELWPIVRRRFEAEPGTDDCITAAELDDIVRQIRADLQPA